MLTHTDGVGIEAQRNTYCHNTKKKIVTINFESEHDYEIEVTKFTEILCNSLEDDDRKQHASLHSHIRTRQDCRESKLEKVAGPDGHVTRPATTKQRYSGRKVSTDVNYQCYVCKKILKRDGSVNHAQTYFCCSIFKIPFFRENKASQ